MTAPMTPADTTRRTGEVLDQVELAVIGKRKQLEVLLATVLAGGHVLIEDNPGLGKTLAARSFAQTLGLSFARAQFTPDLLPSDLTGSFVYDQGCNEFAFREGPVFTGLLLADEINRTPPKTQAALLEAMQERQVTIEGQTFALPRPFHVLATANPIEYEGTYPLPEAQLDRFFTRITFGYPDEAQELDVLERRMARRTETITLSAVVGPEELLAMQESVEQIRVDPSVSQYCVRLAAATRSHGQLAVGASPRGSLALVLLARAVSVVRGRDYVTPEDVKSIATAVLAHRVSVLPELWMTSITGIDVVRELLDSVPTPSSAVRS